MSAPTSDEAAAPSAGRQWALWTVIAAVLLAGLATAVVALLVALPDGLRAHDAVTVGVFAVVSLVYDVVARRVERIRRLTNAGPYVNMGSVFVIACAITLDVVWVVVLILVVYAYLEVQSRIDGGRRPWYRVGFNVAVAVLSFAAAHGVFVAIIGSSGGDGPTGLVLLGAVGAMVTVMVVNTVLIGLAIALSTGKVAFAELVGDRSSNLLELATLAIGALVGVVVPVDVALCLLAVPAMVSLQRSAMVDQLESAASNDAKTGLLNSAAWQALAERELVRCEARGRTATIVVIDLDHFKRVNDTYGHLTGDAVLRAVAETMGDMLRDRDLLARFGGEEFVALLADADAREALRVAERLRARVADVVVTQVGNPPEAVPTTSDPLAGERSRSDQIRVTVSAGLASFPEHGDTVTALLARADAALYDAKHGGRNQVRITTTAA